jgi:AcrR family transcriptional regulator
MVNGTLNFPIGGIMASRRRPLDFFAVALELLEAEGFLAVTAAGLCDRMGVTRGSFYHHFSSIDDFVDRLLEHWEERYTTNPVASVAATEGDEVRREEQLRYAQLLPHGAEAAIRVWSGVNSRVAAAQQRVDRARRSSTAEHLRQLGLNNEDATDYADLAVASLIGMEMLDRPANVTQILRVLQIVQATIDSRRFEEEWDAPVVTGR